jgi:hypothetical protein
MKSKDDVLMEKTLKLAQIQSVCNKFVVRVPASAAQASMKSLAMKVLEIIDAE